MNQEVKQTEVNQIKDQFLKSKIAILTSLTGMTVEKTTELRKELKKAHVDYKVVKNTLAIRAIKSTPYEGATDEFKGPTAVAFGYKDPVDAAKVLAKYLNPESPFKIKCGVYNGKVIDLNTIKQLSELPSREVLLAKLMGSMMSPLNGLVNVLAGVPRSFLNVLNAIGESKKGQVK